MSSENASLNSIIDSADLNNFDTYNTLSKFLKWCSFNISEQIAELFDTLFTNKRTKLVVEARANRLTLNDVGDLLHVTRERIRQIELKAERTFGRLQSRLRILAKLYADRNGQSIITQEDIAEVSGTNANVLIYLLRMTESSFYTYDKQLDAFLIGDTNVAARIQSFIDSLPDVIKKSELHDIIEAANDQEDLAPEYVEKAISESYKVSGDIYHRSKLSITKVYEEVLRSHYPQGLRVNDTREIAEFRKIIIDEYGNLALPENDHAISARIASIGVLSGRGRYIAKRDKWISKSLEKQLLDYIDHSETPVLFVGTLFNEFEDALTKAGIDNRYFLQGVLRELAGDRYIFRRDYISKDEKFTSIYSSIISFIKAHRYPVKKEEIHAKFQGITDVVISFATTDSDILNYFGEYLHGSRLDIREDEKDHIHKQLDTIMSDNEAHHIKDLYPLLILDNPEAFTRNAVDGAFRAYSVLEYYFREQYQFSRPYIAKLGVDIGKPADRLHELIYGENEYLISDIRDFAKENHMQIQSMIDFVNSLNDKFMLYSNNSIASIASLGVTEEIVRSIQDIILDSIIDTIPIRNLTCIARFPAIIGCWSEWLIYSCLYKWSDKLDVALSSGQLRQAIPLVSRKGQMDLTDFKNFSVTPINIQIDDMDDIDNLLSGIITEDMLEDI